MDKDAVKSLLANLQENPDGVFEHQDDLDRIIQKIVAIEKKHLHQIASPSEARRRKEVRELIELELPKVLGKSHDS